MVFRNSISWYILSLVTLQEATGAADDEYNVLHRDGSYEFGYNNPDSYHYADSNRNNVVRGEFGARNPGTGAIDSTIYTAGPRGYRPRGKNVVRKYDLNQNGPRPVGSRDDPYYDPLEDPSYSFSFKTRTYNRDETANRVGDVNGRYSYVDDVGERHNVEFVAGKNTGFHVKTPFPDSNPRGYGPLYFNGRGKPIPRGRTSIQRGTDGSYKFVSSGPDQRRTEVSDATGHVRGSYTYLDDKGVQHSVHYIAGPETGYRVLKQVKGPHLPTVFPFGRPGIIPPDFYDIPKDAGDVFDTAASGRFKPDRNKPARPATGAKPDIPAFDDGADSDKDEFSFGGKKPSGGKPSYADDDTGDFGDLFGDDDIGGSSTTSRPFSKPGASSAEDDGAYKPSGEDGLYKPPGSSSTSRPSYGGGSTLAPVLPPTGEPDSSEVGYEAGLKPTPSFEERPNKPVRPTSSGRSRGRPAYEPDISSNEVGDSFGLFGSETGHPRPPYGTGPVVNIGVSKNCRRCSGTLVTNVGDRTFSVPPGVSVRAHVQAIDLLPVSPSVPSPSEQYKADLLRTEQLNASSDEIVFKNGTRAESGESVEETTTAQTITTTQAASKNSTSS